MLRIDFVQRWHNLGDKTIEDALYDSQAMRDFTGIDLARDRVPDESRGARKPKA